MKKVIIPVLCLLLLNACAGKKEKEKPDTIVKNGTSDNRPPAGDLSADDKLIKDWLLGKEWKAESNAAPFSILKVFSPDSCGYTTGKYHYTFMQGRLEIFGGEWPFTRVNDSTFTIYVEPTQKTYTYKFIKAL